MGSHQAVVVPALAKCQCHDSIGISPPPGTPQAAPFGYWSIIVPCKCHRPNLRHFEVLLRISFIARSLSGGHGAPTISANSAAHGHLTSNVLDEWLFSFQGSLRRNVFLPPQVVGSEKGQKGQLFQKFFINFFRLRNLYLNVLYGIPICWADSVCE